MYVLITTGVGKIVVQKQEVNLNVYVRQVTYPYFSWVGAGVESSSSYNGR